MATALTDVTPSGEIGVSRRHTGALMATALTDVTPTQDVNSHQIFSRNLRRHGRLRDKQRQRVSSDTRLHYRRLDGDWKGSLRRGFIDRKTVARR